MGNTALAISNWDLKLKRSLAQSYCLRLPHGYQAFLWESMTIYILSHPPLVLFWSVVITALHWEEMWGIRPKVFKQDIMTSFLGTSEAPSFAGGTASTPKTSRTQQWHQCTSLAPIFQVNAHRLLLSPERLFKPFHKTALIGFTVPVLQWRCAVSPAPWGVAQTL